MSVLDLNLIRKTVANWDRPRVYLSIACPFSHRVLAALHITGLKNAVSITWMKVIKREAGWVVDAGPDPVFERTLLRDVYRDLDSDEDQRPSVPLMVDTRNRIIISTESGEMTRLIARGFTGRIAARIDLCPHHLENKIDTLNGWLHTNICRAVYRVGFATNQKTYEDEIISLFNSLDKMESRLSVQPYLHGDLLTESDLFLFATLVRFDPIYAPLFKCSIRKISEYPALTRFLLLMLDEPRLAETVDVPANVKHYYGSTIHTKGGTLDFNPTGTIPAGPELLMSNTTPGPSAYFS